MPKFRDMAPGDLAAMYENGSDADRSTLIAFASIDAKFELDLYEYSGNVEHLWRAWRIARAFGEIPPALLAMIVPHLDALASRPETKRAEELEMRNYILHAYYHETSRMKHKLKGAATSKRECERRAAKPFGTTWQRVHQLVLEFEGRGQRGANRIDAKKR